MRTCYLDFEFNRVKEPNLNLVSCCTLDDAGNQLKWWLNGNQNWPELAAYLETFDRIIAYSAIAEARSMLTLGIDILQFKWIDLFLEYRCLTNHNDNLQYGEQLVDGKVKFTHKPRPKWELEEGEEDSPGFKPTHSLAEASFKLLGVMRDTDHKNKMRDLIISDPKEFTAEEQEAILNYNMEDVVSLPLLWDEMQFHYLEMDGDLLERDLIEEAYTRGRYAAHTAQMETWGYPINVEWTKNFSSQVGNIIFDVQREINTLFPDIHPFKWNKKKQAFSWDQKGTREWIARAHEVDKWDKTKGKQLSLSLEAFQKFYDFKHDYPKDSFGAQMVRYLKLKQNIYGFSPSGESKKNFWDSVGSDGMVRPYTNIYGAQSSRSQPASTGFLFLKPAWMRALCQPPKGWAMAGVDYGSEEYYISAILSGERKMIDAYQSGDVYLAFAKDAGMVPRDGTKDEYKRERDLCKSTVLGISYLMTKYGLSIKLSSDTGEDWTEDRAQEMIDKFYEAYPNLQEMQLWILEDYRHYGSMKLPCGWYMWGDNPKFRSVANCNIQGMGASIMRKAVDLARAKGLRIPFTLHDALYIQYEIGKEEQIETLMNCMREAFVFYFPEEDKEDASKIKLDPFAWSQHYEPDSEIVLESGLAVPSSNLYIDERSKVEYEQFKKYFTENVGDLL